MMNALI